MASEPPMPPDLIARMQRLGIAEAELVERFIKGSGPGGQKVNKTSSCVQLRHVPSGIEVKCQQGRSLTANRITARTQICDRVEQREQVRRQRRKAERERVRRQKRRPSKTQRRINVTNKRKHGVKKRLRGKPGRDD